MMPVKSPVGLPDGLATAVTDAAPTISIEFDDDGVTGRLTKTFAGTRGTALLQLGDEQITDPAAVDRRLVEMTGLPSEKFFRSTANVRHQELENLDRDEGALRDRLQVAVSGADTGTSLARRKLEDAIKRLRTEGAKNPGRLKQVRDEIAGLDARVRQGDAELARLQRDQEALSAPPTWAHGERNSARRTHPACRSKHSATR